MVTRISRWAVGFKKEINSVEDLQGLKMRNPGFAGEILAELGAKLTNIAPRWVLHVFRASHTGCTRVGGSISWFTNGFPQDRALLLHRLAAWAGFVASIPSEQTYLETSRLKTYKKSCVLQCVQLLTTCMPQATHESGKNWVSMKTGIPRRSS